MSALTLNRQRRLRTKSKAAFCHVCDRHIGFGEKSSVKWKPILLSKWVWDYYNSYPAGEQINPVGSTSGTLRVYRGCGWNGFAKNLRPAPTAFQAQESKTHLLTETVKILIAYFSWGGNTKGFAEKIQSQTDADLFEMKPAAPYTRAELDWTNKKAAVRLRWTIPVPAPKLQNSFLIWRTTTLYWSVFRFGGILRQPLSTSL